MPRANGITRQEIMTSLKVKGAMTAEELAQELGISQVAVRQHLASLDAEGVITVGVERRGLGRPSHRYTLTERGDEMFPRRYETLASSLLEELRAWQGEDAVDALLARQRERLRTTLEPRLRDKTLSARVDELARIQSEHGSMAESCATGPDTFLLIKRNCVVCAVARHHPEICCRNEAALFQSLLGDVDVARETSIIDGDSTCTFLITAARQP